MSGLIQDIHYAWRSVLRKPALAGTVVLTLALCMGALTAIFTFVNALLVRPLPFRDPAGLMMIEERWLPRFPRFELSPLDFLTLKSESTSFADVAAFKAQPMNLTGRDLPERIAGARISANLTSLVGVEPTLGRGFTPDEDRDGANRVVLLGDALWHRRFGADPSVIGRAIRLDGQSFTVVGVMPGGFAFPRDAELWMPMGFTARELESRGNHIVWAVGRLKPGLTREQAQAELDLMMPRIQKVWGANVVPLVDHYVGHVRRALLILLGAAGFVLLIACTNVTNLLLARASTRQAEFSVRLALGARRTRLIRQLLAETMMLAACGGAIGMFIAWLGVRALRETPALLQIPGAERVSVDGIGLAFAFVVSLSSGAVFGMAPALRLTRDSQHESRTVGALRASSRRRSHMRNALVAFEVAAALVLLVGAGLLIKSLWNTLEVRPGVSPNGVLTARIDLPANGYAEPHQQVRFVEQLLDQLRVNPGVGDAAISTGLPFSNVEDSGIRFERQTADPDLAGTAANHYRVSPRYHQLLGIPLIQGRLFEERDVTLREPVVLINETMARRFFAGMNPIGQRLDISGPTYMRKIVGVVGDVKQEGLQTPTPPQVYEPYYQKPARDFTVLVRASGDPLLLAGMLQQAVRSVDDSQPIAGMRPMNDVIAVTMAPARMTAGLLTLLGLLALLLAALGTSGVLAYSVAQRTPEIGLRVALGAEPGGMTRLVLRQGMQIVLVGIAIGVALSLALSRVLGNLLYDVEPTDPGTLAGVVVVLLTVSTIASFIPARRAARVDPLIALKYE